MTIPPFLSFSTCRRIGRRNGDPPPTLGSGRCRNRNVDRTQHKFDNFRPGFDPSFGKSRTEIIVELGRGAGDGTADLAADAAKIDLLHVPRGVARLAQSAWESEWGLTGLATVVLGPVRQQIEAAADDAATGDFRGAAAAGVKAVTVAVSTGITIGELGAAAVNAIDAGTGVGRTGGQERLKQIAADPNTSSADRGWIKQEMNSIDRGQRDTIRNPPGTQLAHTRGREAAKGYNHVASPSNLQDTDLHRTQHKFDKFGRLNKERP